MCIVDTSKETVKDFFTTLQMDEKLFDKDCDQKQFLINERASQGDT